MILFPESPDDGAETYVKDKDNPALWDIYDYKPKNSSDSQGLKFQVKPNLPSKDHCKHLNPDPEILLLDQNDQISEKKDHKRKCKENLAPLFTKKFRGNSPLQQNREENVMINSKSYKVTMTCHSYLFHASVMLLPHQKLKIFRIFLMHYQKKTTINMKFWMIY